MIILCIPNEIIKDSLEYLAHLGDGSGDALPLPLSGDGAAGAGQPGARLRPRLERRHRLRHARRQRELLAQLHVRPALGCNNQIEHVRF